MQKSSPAHVTFSVKSKAKAADRSTRKIAPNAHEEIALDDLDHSAPSTFSSSLNQWDLRSSKKPRPWCTVRQAITTFILILIVILAAGIAVGIVFGVLGSQLNGNGYRSTTPSNSLSSGSINGLTSHIVPGSQTGAACSSYTTIDDPTRNINQTGGTLSCDNSPVFNTSRGAAWIHFTGSGGSIMPLTSPGINRCGAFLSGYFNGSLPTSSMPQVNASVCFETLADPCGYVVDVSAVFCSPGVIVYFLPALDICSARYCTI